MNRFATAAWATAAMSFTLAAHRTDSAPAAVAYVLLAIASAYVALTHRNKEDD